MNATQIHTLVARYTQDKRLTGDEAQKILDQVNDRGLTVDEAKALKAELDALTGVTVDGGARRLIDAFEARLANAPARWTDFADPDAGSQAHSRFIGELWGPSGAPRPEDVIEGRDPRYYNCFNLAAFASIAATNPKWLEDHIQFDAARNVYTVTFAQPNADGVTRFEVDADFLVDANDDGVGANAANGVLWPKVLEKAYAEYCGGYREGRDGHTVGPVWITSDEYGKPDAFMRAFLGNDSANQTAMGIAGSPDPKTYPDSKQANAIRALARKVESGQPAVFFDGNYHCIAVTGAIRDDAGKVIGVHMWDEWSGGYRDFVFPGEETAYAAAHPEVSVESTERLFTSETLMWIRGDWKT